MYFKIKLPVLLLAIFCSLIGILGIYLYKMNNSIICKDCNVILISIDTLRPDHLGVYGYGKNTSPNIDEWAKESLVFTNMHTVVPITYASFVTLLTGEHPFRTKVVTNRAENDLNFPDAPKLDKNIKTMPRYLKENGYTTGVFLSNPNASIAQKEYPNIDGKKDGIDEYNFFIQDRRSKLLKKPFDWLKKNKEKKLFFWIHLLDPHSPYNPSTESLCQFNTELCDEAQKNNKRDILSKLENQRSIYDKCENSNEVPDDIFYELESLYDAEIADSDIVVGQILKEIKRLNIDKKSIIILYSDHGEGFDHNYNFFHGDVLYNSSTNIAYIMSIPNYSHRIIPAFLDNTQILPTVLELLGIKYSRSANTLSNDTFLSLVNITDPIQPALTKNYSYFSNNVGSKYAISDGEYKYIYSFPAASCKFNDYEEELYNIALDKNETKNIVKKSATIAEKLKKELFKEINKNNMLKLSEKLLEIDWNTGQRIKEDDEILDVLRSLGY